MSDNTIYTDYAHNLCEEDIAILADNLANELRDMNWHIDQPGKVCVDCNERYTMRAKHCKYCGEGLERIDTSGKDDLTQALQNVLSTDE